LGTWVEDTGDRSYWRVHFPSFQPGQRVAYRLYARQKGQQLSSETFSFVVAGWTGFGEVVDYQLATNRLTLTCSCDNPALRPQPTYPHFSHSRPTPLAMDSNHPN